MSQSAENFDTCAHPKTRTTKCFTPEQVPQDARRARVVVLASNPCVNDTRIIRSAEAVATAGYEVTVLAPRTSEPRCEIVNSVRYVRLDLPELNTSKNILNIVFQAVFSLFFNHKSSLIGFFERINLYSRKAWRLGKFIFVPFYLLAQKMLYLIPGSRSFFERTWVPLRRLTAKLKKWLLGVVKSNAVTYFLTRRYIVLFVDEIRKLEPDIIHAHDLYTLPAAVKGAAGSSGKVIYDSHELESEKNTRAGRLDRWIRKAIERKYIQRAAAVVTVCDSIADYLAHAYPIQRPVVIINSTSVTSRSDSDIASDIRSDIGLSRRQPLAVYIGKITVGRGIEQTVEALQSAPEFHLALLGSAHTATLETVMELSERFGVQELVHVLPPVPPGDVSAYIATADISVVTIQNICLSYYFCLPNKLFESLAAGLPVIVSDFPELRRFVEMSKAGLIVDETDPRKIATAMRKAYANRACMQLKGDQLEEINRVYGWEAQQSKLLQLYADLDAANSLQCEA